MNDIQLGLLEKALSDIRELKQQLISKDIGTLTEIKIQFLGDAEPTTVKIKSKQVFGG